MEVFDALEALQRGADRRQVPGAGEAARAGLTIPQSCKRVGISDQTFYSLADQVRALKEDEAQRWSQSAEDAGSGAVA